MIRPARIPVRGYERKQQSRDAEDDERVGEIEGRPVLEVQEVRHVSEPDPVGQIRDAAPDHEPERNGQNRMTGAGAREEVEHPRDGETGQEDDNRRRAREEPEGDPRVRHVVDRKRTDDVHLVVEIEAACHDRLRQLIRADAGERDRAETQPLRPAGPELPLGGGDRRQAIGRRADPDVRRA